MIQLFLIINKINIVKFINIIVLFNNLIYDDGKLLIFCFKFVKYNLLKVNIVFINYLFSFNMYFFIYALFQGNTLSIYL